MSKKISIKYLANSRSAVSVVVDEQTHRAKDFGPTKIPEGSKYVATNGFTLRSRQQPTRIDMSCGILGVRGTRTHLDTSSVIIDLRDILKINFAVCEYNYAHKG